MKNIFSILGPRVLSGVLSMLSGWVFVQTKGVVTVDPAAVVEIGGTMLTSYAVGHRALSALFNPGDSATRRMVTAEKDAVATGTAIIPEVKR